VTGDGVGDLGFAELRVLHLGPNVATIDVFLYDAVNPLAVPDFEQCTVDVTVPAGGDAITLTPEADPDTTLLTIDPVDVVDGVKYSAVAYDYQVDLTGLLLVDDDANIDPASTLLQVSHTAPDVGEIDIYTLGNPPALLIADLGFGETTILEVPAASAAIGVDTNNDMNFEWTFAVPNLGSGNFIDLYAVNESGGDPLFLLAHRPDGTTQRIDADVCSNNVIEGLEVCDGTALGGLTCEDFGGMGTLGCQPDCSDYDTSMCSMEIAICNNTVTAIPDANVGNPITIPIEVPNAGTVADVKVSVNISHTFLADVYVRLNKDGMMMTRMFRDISQVGSNASCGGDNMVATLDDAANLPVKTDACINANNPAVNGTFKPEEPLSNFDGMSSAGTWNLLVIDDLSGDTGQVNEWCIYITLQ